MEELLFGSPPGGSFRPMSGVELAAWAGYDKIRAWEHKQQEERMRSTRGRR